jgi:hypothetical protein
VVGRYVFYNNSAFDGHDPAANAADDNAIATDKVPRLPGERGGFANTTSYDKGINGVVVDVANLPAGQTLTPDDFDATVRPQSVTVRRGAGVGGSDRVTLLWPDYNPGSMRANVDVVINGWLRVTVKANAHTGLSVPDVFAFGNLVGETGDNPPGLSVLRVTARDLAKMRRGMGAAAGVATAAHNPLDVNRDGRVNALDLAMVRRRLGRSLLMQVMS